MYGLNIVVLLLVLVGALNWGLVGIFNINLVEMVFGSPIDGKIPLVERVVYAVIGVAGLWGLTFLGKCKALCCCKKSDSNSKGNCCGGKGCK